MNEPEPLEAIMKLLEALQEGQDAILKLLRKKVAKSADDGSIPSLDDVLAYCLEREEKDKTWSSFDAEEFYLANDVKGWVYGPKQTPVRSWKSHMSRWKLNGYCQKKAPSISDNVDIEALYRNM